MLFLARRAEPRGGGPRAYARTFGLGKEGRVPGPLSAMYYMVP